MDGDADVAKVAALFADPARVRMMFALADGRALPASELAGRAGIATSTASAHLSKLLDGGLFAVEQQGRHRYFRLASADGARLLESMAALSPPAAVRSLRDARATQAVRFARTCYDHLAGVLGTELMDALLQRELIVDHELSKRGSDAMGEFGIAIAALPRRRPLIRHCLDWSERRHHLAGSLGAAIARRMFELGWIERSRGSRAVLVGDLGREGLRRHFGVILD